MIQVTRLHGEVVFLAAEQILIIERTPDTTLILLNGQRIMVRETPEEVVERVVAYRRRTALPQIIEQNQDPDTSPPGAKK